MLQPFNEAFQKRRVRSLQATHCEISLQEMNTYLERKMRDYTVKHFKKIWCIEHTVAEFKKNLNKKLEQIEIQKANERKMYEAFTSGKWQNSEQSETDNISTPSFTRKYRKIPSPIRNSSPPMFAGGYSKKLSSHHPHSPFSDEFLENSHLNECEVSINIEPLAAVLDEPQNISAPEIKPCRKSDPCLQDPAQIDRLPTANDDRWAAKNSAELVVLGPHGTTANAEFMMSLDWSTGSQVTRKLLAHIFDRETLASHTLTGKPSPAFKDREMPDKKPLDPLKVADIVHAVTMYANCTAREVRMAITTKCADENKMLKNKSKANKENSSPGYGKSGKLYTSKKY